MRTRQWVRIWKVFFLTTISGVVGARRSSARLSVPYQLFYRLLEL